MNNITVNNMPTIGIIFKSLSPSLSKKGRTMHLQILANSLAQLCQGTKVAIKTQEVAGNRWSLLVGIKNQPFRTVSDSLGIAKTLAKKYRIKHITFLNAREEVILNLLTAIIKKKNIPILDNQGEGISLEKFKPVLPSYTYSLPPLTKKTSLKEQLNRAEAFVFQDGNLDEAIKIYNKLLNQPETSIIFIFSRMMKLARYFNEKKYDVDSACRIYTILLDCRDRLEQTQSRVHPERTLLDDLARQSMRIARQYREKKNNLDSALKIYALLLDRKIDLKIVTSHLMDIAHHCREENNDYDSAFSIYLLLYTYVHGEVRMIRRILNTVSSDPGYRQSGKGKALVHSMLEIYEKKIKDKTSPRILEGTCYLYYFLGKFDRVLELTGNHPQDLGLLHERAEAFRKMKQYADALAIFERILKETNEPSLRAQACAGKGYCQMALAFHKKNLYDKLHGFEKAVATFDQAIQVGDEVSHLRSLCGKGFIFLGVYKITQERLSLKRTLLIQAKEVFQKVLNKNPQNSKALQGMKEVKKLERNLS